MPEQTHAGNTHPLPAGSGGWGGWEVAACTYRCSSINRATIRDPHMPEPDSHIDPPRQRICTITSKIAGDIDFECTVITAVVTCSSAIRVALVANFYI